MNVVARRWSVRVLGLLLLTGLYACLVPDVGYVGGAYEPTGYVYGGWGPGYHVGPPPHGRERGERGGERRPEQAKPSPPRAYRPAPPSREVPSIPSRPHGH
jgi:hypothetical protein